MSEPVQSSKSRKSPVLQRLKARSRGGRVVLPSWILAAAPTAGLGNRYRILRATKYLSLEFINLGEWTMSFTDGDTLLPPEQRLSSCLNPSFPSHFVFCTVVTWSFRVCVEFFRALGIMAGIVSPADPEPPEDPGETSSLTLSLPVALGYPCFGPTSQRTDASHQMRVLSWCEWKKLTS